jgi:hypothetical protein
MARSSGLIEYVVLRAERYKNIRTFSSFMRAVFCETTLDIILLLSRKEIVDLRRTEECTPYLDVETKGVVFHLSGIQSKEYMKIREPEKNGNDYWIKINDSAYDELVRNNRCGTRYGNSSKVTVCLDEDA